MKINKTLAIAGILSLSAASSAFAAVADFTDSGTVTTGTPTVTIKPSKNVTVRYLAHATTIGTGVISYSISSNHSSGTKLYASSSGDTKIFMKDATTIADPPAAPALNTSMDPTDYTAM